MPSTSRPLNPGPVLTGADAVAAARAYAEQIRPAVGERDVATRSSRTHTLHSPVAYKAEEVGRLFLRGEIPTPSDYR